MLEITISYKNVMFEQNVEMFSKIDLITVASMDIY